MFKGNMSKLLKQAQEMQTQIEEVQNQLSDMIIESESGGGMVSVKVNGKQEVLELNIEESALEEDKEVERHNHDAYAAFLSLFLGRDQNNNTQGNN